MNPTPASGMPSDGDYIRALAFHSSINDDPVVKVHHARLMAIAQRLDAPQPPAAEVPTANYIERMKHAIEGECDGLAITDEHARAIIEYVWGPIETILTAIEPTRQEAPTPLTSDEHEVLREAIWDSVEVVHPGVATTPTPPVASEAVARLLPIFEKLLKDCVFTTDKAGQVQADMNTLRSLAAPPTVQAAPAGYRIFKDGDKWCAVGHSFIDLQQSPAGFADTPGEALEALMKEFGKDWAAKNGEWVQQARLLAAISREVPSERAAFEAWFDREMPSLARNVTTYGDDQVAIHSRAIAWATWQARAALASTTGTASQEARREGL